MAVKSVKFKDSNIQTKLHTYKVMPNHNTVEESIPKFLPVLLFFEDLNLVSVAVVLTCE